MIWPSTELLEKTEELKRRGISWPLEPGAMVARGYADVGYESFVLLPNRRLVSLFTAQSSELLQDHQQFFFVVPNLAMILDRLSRLGVSLVKTDYVLQKEWRVLAQNEKGRALGEFCGRSLDELLLEVLLNVGEGQE